jgi:hypothetical protein
MPIPTAPNSASNPPSGEAARDPARPTAPAPAAPAFTDPESFQPVALVLAIVFPGLGHYYLGQRRRAPFICLGVLGLFLSGMLIGGIDCIDRRENPVWFAGQALVGPIAWGADWLHENVYKVRDADNSLPRDPRPNELRDPDGIGRRGEIDPATGGLVARYTDRDGRERVIRAAHPGMSKSLGAMNYLGTLFAAVAGMLNLIVIVDAAYHDRRAARAGGRA